MIGSKPYVFWFVTGSMHLYGPETLDKVEKHAQTMSGGIGSDPSISYQVLCKSVLKTPKGDTQALALYSGECG